MKELSVKISIALFVLLALSGCSSTKKIKSENGISQAQYLELGGVKQYVLIRGEELDNPILLFLHGGPGASATALLRKFNSELEKYFTVVYWDQRGAGKSYDRLMRPEDITVQHYKEDLQELTA